jgi:hypothetical protein
MLQIIEEPVHRPEAEDDQLDRGKGTIRKGLHTFQKSASDEDSDFDE